MDETESVSALVGAIYDAALDTSLWPAVLGQTADFMPGLSASLFAKDAAAKSLAIHFEDGRRNPVYTELYIEKYAKLDPFTAQHYFADIGEPMSLANFCSFDEFEATRIYREWVKPQEIVDFVSVALEKTATNVAMFGIFRHERHGLIDDDARRRMRLIAPHVRRAVLIGRAIDLKAAQAATFSDAFDRLSSSMLLIDDGGRIVHGNAAAHAMLESGNVLKAQSGRVATNDASASQNLHDILDAAALGDAALGMRGIAFPIKARNGETYVAHVLPLTSGERRLTGSAFAASAMLMIQNAELTIPAMPEVIAKTYKLTPTELRVLLAIAEIGGAPEIAEAFGIAESTVKTHLNSLFGKTGARRQADLVKLLAGFKNPLLP
ncbi:MAG: helix-turn-helix transcriptional regulator [Pseudolabrys sp.]